MPTSAPHAEQITVLNGKVNTLLERVHTLEKENAELSLENHRSSYVRNLCRDLRKNPTIDDNIKVELECAIDEWPNLLDGVWIPIPMWKLGHISGRDRKQPGQHLKDFATITGAIGYDSKSRFVGMKEDRNGAIVADFNGTAAMRLEATLILNPATFFGGKKVRGGGGNDRVEQGKAKQQQVHDACELCDGPVTPYAGYCEPCDHVSYPPIDEQDTEQLPVVKPPVKRPMKLSDFKKHTPLANGTCAACGNNSWASVKGQKVCMFDSTNTVLRRVRA